MSAPLPPGWTRPPLPEWFRYDVLLHDRCGKKLSEHPMPHAPAASCPFPALPPREFVVASTEPQAGDGLREAAEQFWSDLINEDDQGAIDKLIPLLVAEAAVQRVEGVARRLDACHGMTLDRPGEARAYREAAEWIRRALDGPE